MKKLALIFALALATTRPLLARVAAVVTAAMGVEFTAGRSVGFNGGGIAVAIVTSIEVAAMATGTTDVMAIIMDTAVVIRSRNWARYFRRRFRWYSVINQ